MIFCQSKDRRYQSMDYLNEIRKDTIFVDSLDGLERNLQENLRFAEAKDHVLPVVFHILFSNEEDRIDQQLIHRQLKLLNDDFAGRAVDGFLNNHADEDRRGIKSKYLLPVDTRIQFCLADDDGESTLDDAIDYQHTFIEVWENRQLMKTEFGSPIKSPEKYINIWLCNLPKGEAGYAQLPHGPSQFDGIVMDISYIKDLDSEDSNYGLGHTLTHLMGNYLGLYPLWGPSPCHDDYVKDTPIHNAPNFGILNARHVSTCAGYPTELVNNFMDATDDSGLNSFTEGQRDRMQAFLSEGGPRAALSEDNTNCQDALDELIEERLSMEMDPVPNREVKIFPNPTSDHLNVFYESENFQESSSYQIYIYNSSGEQFFFKEQSLSVNKTIVDVNQWPSSLYLLKIEDGNFIKTLKFIVE